jgi:hypothetical protein
MNNSDHIALAINDILKNSSEVRDGTSFKAMKPEDLKKKLKDEYGIDSELTKVKDKNGTEIAALKFSNGAVFADGAGDGKLDTGDYNFAGKVAEIEKKYGVSADELVKGMKDQKTRIDRYYPGAQVDLSGALQDGLQGTADRVKYKKEVEATRAELLRQVDQAARHLSSQTEFALRDVAYSLSLQFRREDAVRLAIVAGSKEQALQRLKDFGQTMTGDSRPAILAPRPRTVSPRWR